MNIAEPIKDKKLLAEVMDVYESGTKTIYYLLMLFIQGYVSQIF